MQDLLNKWGIKMDYNLLLEMWNESQRSYHTQSHLADLITQINELKGLSEKQYDKLMLCALFHDIVYEPTRSDNEERSAEFFENCCIKKGDPDILEVKRMILDTKTHEATSELSEIFNRLDMNIVESDYERLLEWESGIHNEFSFAGSMYKEYRLKFLESLLDKYPKNTDNLLKLINYVKLNYEDNKL